MPQRSLGHLPLKDHDMLNTLALFTTLALAPDGTAVFDGTYKDVSGAPHSYSVSAEVDGTISDTEGRTGVYSITMNATGARVLTLDLGRLGYHTLYEGPTNCWEEALPPVNSGLLELAICLTPYDHRIVHFDTAACSDFDTSPIFHTAATYPQEAGHWMAGRLTSDSPNGFWVHDFTYVLNISSNASGYYCSAIDHKAQVFMGPSNLPPPASPTVLFEASVSGASLTGDFSEVTVDLPNPILLPPGQSLFVSIEALDDGVEEVCPSMCGSGSTLEDHTYWSDAATAPYSWYDLEPFGFYDLMVQAHGIAAS
jgi:hypothetical protein